MPHEVRPWTLKTVPEDLRAAAIAAASKAAVGIGVWVTEAIQRRLQADQTPAEEVTPEQSAEATAKTLELLQRVREVAGDPPEDVLKGVWDLVRRRLAATVR